VAAARLRAEAVIERFDVAVLHGVPGGMWESPTLFSQNRCSARETNSGPLSIRRTFGGPPATRMLVAQERSQALISASGSAGVCA